MTKGNANRKKYLLEAKSNHGYSMINVGKQLMSMWAATYKFYIGKGSVCQRARQKMLRVGSEPFVHTVYDRMYVVISMYAKFTFIPKVHCNLPGTAYIILPGLPESQGLSLLQFPGDPDRLWAAPPGQPRFCYLFRFPDGMYNPGPHNY